MGIGLWSRSYLITIYVCAKDWKPQPLQLSQWEATPGCFCISSCLERQVNNSSDTDRSISRQRNMKQNLHQFRWRLCPFSDWKTHSSARNLAITIDLLVDLLRISPHWTKTWVKTFGADEIENCTNPSSWEPSICNFRRSEHILVYWSHIWPSGHNDPTHSINASLVLG